MGTKYNHSPDTFEIGNEYQEFVALKWPEVYPFGFEGIMELNFFETKHEQFNIGETEEGVEVKKDQIFRTSKRLYIETAEKANIENKEYVPSGIYRTDNSIYYLIGDETQWWIFSKDDLQEIDRKSQSYPDLFQWVLRPLKPKDSSMGFCINIKEAHIYCMSYMPLM